MNASIDIHSQVEKEQQQKKKQRIEWLKKVIAGQKQVFEKSEIYQQ